MTVERRPRIAFFTPLLPVQSGISDYSEELLPHLAEQMEMDLVIDTGYAPSSRLVTSRFRCLTATEFLVQANSYDMAIYQIANSYDHHAYVIPCMEALPGILVLHDFCLQYLVVNLLLRQGKLAALAEVLRPVWGEEADGLARRLQLGLVDPNVYRFSRPLIEKSRGVIVHSQLACELVLKEFPQKVVEVIRMGVPLDFQPDEGIRSRYGLAAGDYVVASVSTLSHTKRLDKIVLGFASFHRNHSQSKLLLVGGGALGGHTRQLIAARGLTNSVVATGWVSNEDYAALIATADVVVDLRHPSGAETSASLSRAIAAGKPLIVSEQGTFVEFPNSFTLKIPVDDNEVPQFSQYLEILYLDGVQRRRMGEAALQFARDHLSLETAASRYAAFVEKVRRDPQTAVAPGPLFPGKGARLDALLYKACRVGYLYRNYGFRDTLRRVYREMSGKR